MTPAERIQLIRDWNKGYRNIGNLDAEVEAIDWLLARAERLEAALRRIDDLDPDIHQPDCANREGPPALWCCCASMFAADALEEP